MTHFEINDCDETRHGVDRTTGRAYTIIGWIKGGGLCAPILVPDEIALGEPLPIKAERVAPRPVIIPDGM